MIRDSLFDILLFAFYQSAFVLSLVEEPQNIEPQNHEVVEDRFGRAQPAARGGPGLRFMRRRRRAALQNRGTFAGCVPSQFAILYAWHKNGIFVRAGTSAVSVDRLL